MNILKKYIFIASLLVSMHVQLLAQSIEQHFLKPPSSAKPWVFWYWLHGAVSREGITADLEAMKEVGIGGAYLMPVKDTNSKIPFQPQVRQLTAEWWTLVKFALQEAKRLQLQVGVHVSDGFALAGGPWIRPEMSMQKLVWTKTFVRANNREDIILAQPETKENYYRDIAVYAYPVNYTTKLARNTLVPEVSSSNGAYASFLPYNTTNQTFRSDSNCWIQYSYSIPVTIRQVKIRKQNNAYQSQRFIIQQSEDGTHFIPVDTLVAPRHGWQDWDEAYTHSVRTFTSRYIRFVWQKEGTEPGSEDLDAAKWKPVLRVQEIYISDEPVTSNYEAKNGSVWRVAAAATAEVSKEDAVPLKSIINLSSKLSADGTLNWKPPAGQKDWVIVRIGHTSTGHTNATGGGGKGLECDKFSTEATTLQFNNWFGKFYTETDPVLAKQVIKVFHIDSWECGSQNWSNNFAAEFKKRRSYDLLPYLVVMTGTPVTDAATSEKVLYDVRQTIAELVNDKFYVTLKELAHAKGCKLSAESIAPTFVSDGLMHYKHADIPMGEFWLNSPTHDKPNDLSDAISGAHMYGKNIVAAEAFTSLRSDWGEHPGNLKALGDRVFASGINKFSLHVFMHNPWLNKKPGMTLDGIGLFYQRDQTWFRQSKVWIDYLTRCQALLQLGKPVVDIAVFTGEEIPRRSLLPDRLVNTLPGIFGKERVETENKRLQNAGQPQRAIPDGVSHAANMADPENYIDALNGYQYDSFNPDILLQLKVLNGRIVTPAGTSYAILVIPGKHPMNPDARMSEAVRNKFKQLADAGAKIIVDTKLYNLQNKNFITAPYAESNFEKLGVKKSLIIENGQNEIAWTHRRLAGADIYFISNQQNKELLVKLSFGLSGKRPEVIDPVSKDISESLGWYAEKGRTFIQENLAPYQSLFIVFRENAEKYEPGIRRAGRRSGIDLDRGWMIQFKGPVSDSVFTVVADSLSDLMKSADPRIRYFSGTAAYSNTFFIDQKQHPRHCSVQIDSLHNLATVRVNGVDCGIAWTAPFVVDITKAVKPGRNTIEIEVTNTWRNRLIGDELNLEKRRTWFNSPYPLKNKPLLPAGIIGRVRLFYSND